MNSCRINVLLEHVLDGLQATFGNAPELGTQVAFSRTGDDVGPKVGKNVFERDDLEFKLREVVHLHFNLRGRFAATTMTEAGGVRNLTGGGLA